LLFLQIALGGWVSANYAGVACPSFPTCNGLWFPKWHFSEGFHLLSPVGANYQGGLLDMASRVTIQVVHRLGAVIAGGYILVLSLFLIGKLRRPGIRMLAFCLLLLVLLQWCLGIINALYLLPLAVAVAHNGVAALLMATLTMLFVLCRRPNGHLA
jgi:cytochrome c oxidase assembly protein subunit 15